MTKGTTTVHTVLRVRPPVGATATSMSPNAKQPAIDPSDAPALAVRPRRLPSTSTDDPVGHGGTRGGGGGAMSPMSKSQQRGAAAVEAVIITDAASPDLSRAIPAIPLESSAANVKTVRHPEALEELESALGTEQTTKQQSSSSVEADRSSKAAHASTSGRAAHESIIAADQTLFCFGEGSAATRTQSSVFEATGRRAVDSVLHGVNTAVVAYGAHLSGKSYTLWGPQLMPPGNAVNPPVSASSSSSPQKTASMSTPWTVGPKDGLFPRAVKELFSRLDRKSDSTTTATATSTAATTAVVSSQVTVSIVEFYNERARDLLVDDSDSAAHGNGREHKRTVSGDATSTSATSASAHSPTDVDLSQPLHLVSSQGRREAALFSGFSVKVDPVTGPYFDGVQRHSASSTEDLMATVTAAMARASVALHPQCHVVVMVDVARVVASDPPSSSSPSPAFAAAAEGEKKYRASRARLTFAEVASLSDIAALSTAAKTGGASGEATQGGVSSPTGLSGSVTSDTAAAAAMPPTNSPSRPTTPNRATPRRRHSTAAPHQTFSRVVGTITQHVADAQTAAEMRGDVPASSSVSFAQQIAESRDGLGDGFGTSDSDAEIRGGVENTNVTTTTQSSSQSAKTERTSVLFDESAAVAFATTAARTSLLTTLLSTSLIGGANSSSGDLVLIATVAPEMSTIRDTRSTAQLLELVRGLPSVQNRPHYGDPVKLVAALNRRVARLRKLKHVEASNTAVSTTASTNVNDVNESSIRSQDPIQSTQEIAHAAEIAETRRAIGVWQRLAPNTAPATATAINSDRNANANDDAVVAVAPPATAVVPAQTPATATVTPQRVEQETAATTTPQPQAQAQARQSAPDDKDKVDEDGSPFNAKKKTAKKKKSKSSESAALSPSASTTATHPTESSPTDQSAPVVLHDGNDDDGDDDQKQQRERLSGFVAFGSPPPHGAPAGPPDNSNVHDASDPNDALRRRSSAVVWKADIEEVTFSPRGAADADGNASRNDATASQQHQSSAFDQHNSNNDDNNEMSPDHRIQRAGAGARDDEQSQSPPGQQAYYSPPPRSTPQGQYRLADDDSAHADDSMLTGASSADDRSAGSPSMPRGFTPAPVDSVYQSPARDDTMIHIERQVAALRRDRDRTVADLEVSEEELRDTRFDLSTSRGFADRLKVDVDTALERADAAEGRLTVAAAQHARQLTNATHEIRVLKARLIQQQKATRRAEEEKLDAEQRMRQTNDVLSPMRTRELFDDEASFLPSMESIDVNAADAGATKPGAGAGAGGSTGVAGTGAAEKTTASSSSRTAKQIDGSGSEHQAEKKLFASPPPAAVQRKMDGHGAEPLLLSPSAMTATPGSSSASGLDLPSPLAMRSQTTTTNRGSTRPGTIGGAPTAATAAAALQSPLASVKKNTIEAALEAAALDEQLDMAERLVETMRQAHQEELAQLHQSYQAQLDERAAAVAESLSHVSRAKRAGREALSDRDDARADAALREQKIRQLESEIGRLSSMQGHRDQESVSAVERAEKKAAAAIADLQREREQRHQLVIDGRRLLLQLQTARAFGVDHFQTVTQPGRAGVGLWLDSYGLRQYQAALESLGFDDLLAMSKIRDDDLHDQKLQMLAGHRRKLVSAAAQLSQTLQQHHDVALQLLSPPSLTTTTEAGAAAVSSASGGALGSTSDSRDQNFLRSSSGGHSDGGSGGGGARSSHGVRHGRHTQNAAGERVSRTVSPDSHNAGGGRCDGSPSQQTSPHFSGDRGTLTSSRLTPPLVGAGVLPPVFSTTHDPFESVMSPPPKTPGGHGTARTSGGAAKRAAAGQRSAAALEDLTARLEAWMQQLGQ